LENVGYVHELITERSSRMFGAGAVFCTLTHLMWMWHIWQFPLMFMWH